MHVIHIDRQNSWTGQTNRVLNIVKGLQARGHTGGVITPPGSQLGLRCSEAGVPVAAFPMRGVLANFSILRIARYLRASRPDILHSHGPRDHLYALIAGRLAGVPHILRTKHNHTRLKSGFFSRYQYNLCTRVVTVSEFIRTRLIEDGLSPDLVETIYTAVDLQRFSPRPKNTAILEQLQIGSDELVIGCLSSLHVRKGVEEILRAVRMIAEAAPQLKIRCLLVGKKWQRWSGLAGELGIADRVTLTGFRQDVPELLSVFDIYVLPSRDEGLGTSILEAMAMGLPVVVSHAGGITEAVGEDAGLVVPPGNAAAVAESLRRLIDDPGLRRDLSGRARDRVERLFSVDVLIERTIALYEHILADKR